MRAILYVLLTCAGFACTPSEPPKFSPSEKECFAVVEAEHAVKLAACGSNVEGPCASRALVKAKLKDRKACLD